MRGDGDQGEGRRMRKKLSEENLEGLVLHPLENESSGGKKQEEMRQNILWEEVEMMKRKRKRRTRECFFCGTKSRGP